MGVFHVFKIVQMVPDRAMHHICQTDFWAIVSYVGYILTCKQLLD